MAENDTPQEKRKNKGIGCLVSLLIGVAIAAIVVFSSPDSSSSKPFSAILITTVGKNLVKEQLLAPSTAKFSDVDAYSYNNNPKRFKVTGKVDSQNMFGAMLRKQFEIIFEYQGSIDDSTSRKLDTNNWKIIYFNMY